MNVVFLDIDGVLNSSSSVMASIGPDETHPAVQTLMSVVGDLPYGVGVALRHVDPVAVGLLNRLLAETNAGLVLISTHRAHFMKLSSYESDHHLMCLRVYMTALGIKVPEMFSVTKRMSTTRGAEVEEWLENHPTDKYAILDDSRDFHSYQHLVKVNGKYGFVFDDYTNALKYLGITPSDLILPYEAR